MFLLWAAGTSGQNVQEQRECPAEAASESGNYKELVEQASQPTGTDEYDISCYMSPASHPSKPHPNQISLLIEGQPVDIELDTRASMSPHVKKSISARSPHTTFCNQVAHIFRRALTCNRGDNRRCDLWAATSPLTPGGGCR